jgi:hypothetical protein
LKQTQSAWVEANDVRLQERKAHLLKRRAGTSLIAQSQRIHLLLATAGMSGAAADCQARCDRERGARLPHFVCSGGGGAAPSSSPCKLSRIIITIATTTASL